MSHNIRQFFLHELCLYSTWSTLQTPHFHGFIRTPLDVTRESLWTSQHKLIVSWTLMWRATRVCTWAYSVLQIHDTHRWRRCTIWSAVPLLCGWHTHLYDSEA